MKPKIIFLIILIAAIVFSLIFMISSIKNHGITGKLIGGETTVQIKENSDGIFEIISPDKIEILNDFDVVVRVKNNAETEKSYILEIMLIDTGVIEEQENYSFSLKKEKSTEIKTFFSSSNPIEHEILARLLSSDGKLVDIKRTRIKLVSPVGPFDFSIDLLTRSISPEDSLPITLTLLNTGAKGEEVDVRTKIYCQNETITNNFPVFLKPSIEAKKVISMIVCNEEGFKLITSEVIFADTVLASTSTRFFIKKPIPLKIIASDAIKIKKGESKIFDVTVENDGKSPLNNLKIAIENIATTWYSVEPAAVGIISPLQTIVFIVNLNIPANIEAQEIPIKISAGSAEGMASKEVLLSILEGEAKKEESLTSGVIGQKVKETENKEKSNLFWIVFALFFLLFIIIMLLIRRRKLNSYGRNSFSLKEIRRV